MRKRTLGVVLLAGLAISGSGAFTAANNMDAVADAGENVAGYGSATVTGATVTDISYDLDDTDPALLDAVIFVATGDLTSKVATMVLRSTSGIIGDYSCSAAASGGVTLLGTELTPGDTVFTCAAADVAVASVTATGLTVSQ